MPEIPDSIQEFPLTKDSLVFVVGAFGGHHSQYYVDHYDPTMHLFEPQVAKADILKWRFKDYPKVTIFPFGLGDVNGEFMLSEVGTDAASFIPHILNGQEYREGPYCDAKMVELSEYLRDHNISDVDLALMNCEGSEFVLLPHMMRTGLVNQFRYLMVQFHPTRKGFDKLDSIVKDMEATHKLRDDYRPQWIIWERINE